MTEPRLPPMITLSVPVGPDPGDVFVGRMPIYLYEGRPSAELLEHAIRVLADQTVKELRAAERLLEGL